MTEEIKDKLTELREIALEYPLKVLAEFNHYYGEDRVDLQFPSIEEIYDKIRQVYSCPEEYTISLRDNDLKGFIDTYLPIHIYVHFPEVDVTNEHGKSIKIWDLYAKVRISTRGELIGTFMLNRSTYDIFQYSNNYMHSHISSIPKNNISSFQSPCLGDGPIIGTATTLAGEFDELSWGLFCLELDKFTQVESLSGGPYKRLEQLGNTTSSNLILGWDVVFGTLSTHNLPGCFNRNKLVEFMKFAIESKELAFNFNGIYNIGMSFLEYIITISNLFIKWVNEETRRNRESGLNLDSLFRYSIIYRAIVKDGKIYVYNSPIESNLEGNIGREVLTFKGEPVLLNISDFVQTSNQENYSYFLETQLANTILNNILNILNYECSKPKTRDQEGTTRDSKTPIFI